MEKGGIMSNSEQEGLAAAILSENLADILDRAQSGDTHAAREVLGTLALLLSSKHPRTGEPAPVPVYVRDYLARALRRMAAGERADVAMNFKKSGKQKWGHFEKRLAADLVFQLVERGLPVLAACQEASAKIQEIVEADPCPAAWLAFKGRTPESETLQSWYYEMRNELGAMRRGGDL
jgi:hypothetical protein